uniref:Uncharacterized protein n=1 Tax=Aegilops tauschii subsp. strangulata TaxID=200361 RepID=A0A453JL61_AEGTS
AIARQTSAFRPRPRLRPPAASTHATPFNNDPSRARARPGHSKEEGKQGPPNGRLPSPHKSSIQNPPPSPISDELAIHSPLHLAFAFPRIRTMGEGSSEAIQDGGALSAPSVGTEAVAAVRKTVKMSETRDFIPCAAVSEGDYSRSSGSSSAAAALPDVASCTGSSEAAPRDDADAEMHHTPDYTRRGAAGRLRIAPLELFSAAPSSPAVPCPPAKAADAENATGDAAGAGGGTQEEAMGCQIAHTDKGNDGCCGQLRQEYDSLLREKGECRRVLEDLMRENELKTKECREAQTSLRELQMELMRKSMHVGSLAFAVEGQVKEKSRWCQLLKDLGEKFKALKTEHQILLKESEEYKKCLSDATQMTTTIHQYVSQYASLESEFKDLKEKFSEEAKERKDLYNKLIELKGKLFILVSVYTLLLQEMLTIGPNATCTLLR